MDKIQQFKEGDVKFHKENHRFGDGKSFDYSQINEHIFLGTNMCCIVGYAQELVEKGVVADISLEGERIDNPLGVDYFLWLPTQDTFPPAPEKLELGVKTIDFLVTNNTKLYVHCKNGHGRAPTLVIAYLVSKGMNLDDALSHVKQKRSTIHLNERQINAVDSFKKTL